MEAGCLRPFNPDNCKPRNGTRNSIPTPPPLFTVPLPSCLLHLHLCLNHELFSLPLDHFQLNPRNLIHSHSPTSLLPFLLHTKPSLPSSTKCSLPQITQIPQSPSIPIAFVLFIPLPFCHPLLVLRSPSITNASIAGNSTLTKEVRTLCIDSTRDAQPAINGLGSDSPVC